jgi:hypothetical protein
MIYARLTLRAALKIMHYAVLFLIVATMIEVFKTIAGIIRDLEKDNEILLAGALVAALVPSGAVLFWGCKAFAVYLDLPIKRVRRYFRNQRKIYSLRHPIADDLFDRQEPRVAFADPPAGPASRALEASPASSPDRAANVAREPPRSAQRRHQVGRRSGAGGLWMCAAFCSALTLVVVVLAAVGTGEKGTGIALHLTGRLSLLFFWPAYAGAAMAALFGPRFAVLVRYGRNFGLAYASAHLVHVGLVAHLVSMSSRPIAESIMPFFAVGVVWTYLLALFSLERLSNLFSPSFLRILRNVGLEYLALVFFADLVLLPIRVHTNRPLEYLPFSILIIVGPILRMAATVRGLGPLGARQDHHPLFLSDRRG